MNASFESPGKYINYSHLRASHVLDRVSPSLAPMSPASTVVETRRLKCACWAPLARPRQSNVNQPVLRKRHGLCDPRGDLGLVADGPEILNRVSAEMDARLSGT